MQHRLCPWLVAAGLALWVAPGCATGKPAAAGDGGAGDSGGGIDAAPDVDANTCPAAPCDLLEQCGCGVTQVCDLDGTMLASGATACRDVTAPGTDLAGCTVSSECAGGYVCLGSPGQCRRFCDASDPAACPGGGHCLVNVTYDAGGGDYQPVPGAITCTKACQPQAAANNGCPSSPQFGCRIFAGDPTPAMPQSGDEYFLTDCTSAPASGGGDGASCTYGADCAPGFGCVTFTPQGGGTPSSQCKQTCVWAVDGQAGARACGGGRTCTEFTSPLLLDTTEYGFCS